jgi:hypothetical protein
VRDEELAVSEATVRRKRTRGPQLPLSDDRAWSRADVAYFLGYSESTVTNLERDGLLPALPRAGRRVTYDPKIIRAFRDGWRPTPGSRAPAPAPQVVPIDSARSAKR